MIDTAEPPKLYLDFQPGAAIHREWFLSIMFVFQKLLREIDSRLLFAADQPRANQLLTENASTLIEHAATIFLKHAEDIYGRIYEYFNATNGEALGCQ